MFSSLRRALVGLVVIAASTVAVPVATSVVTAADGTIDNTNWSPRTGGLAQVSASFTENGIAETFKAFASAETSSGGLLVAGVVGDDQNYTTHMALVRVTSGGELDTSFGGNGLIVYDLGLDGSNNQIYSHADAIFPTSSGFLIGGWSGGSWFNGKSTLMKVSEAGVLDTTWGTNGFVIASEAPTRWNYGAGNYWVDGTTILMLSNDTGNGQVWVHQFAESTGAPVNIGTGGTHYVTISNSDFGGRSPEASIALSSGSDFIFISQGGNASTALVYRFDTSGNSPALDATFGTNGVQATSIPDHTIKPLVRAGNGGFWMVGSNGDSSSSTTTFTRLTAGGLIDATYGPNSDGYVNISNFYTRLGTVANDSNGNLLLVGRLSGDDKIMRFVGSTGAADAGFTNGTNAPGVASASGTCGLSTYGWLVPTSNGNFFQVSGQGYFANGQSVSGFRALKWINGGLQATACDGYPPTGQVVYATSSYTGSTGTAVNIATPTTSNWLATPTFAVSQFGSPLPTGLTLNTNNGAISGTPTDDSNAFVTIEATADLGGGVTQSGSASIQFTITSPQQNNPGPNPNQPPRCTVGSLTVTGTSPVLDTSWGTNGWTTVAGLGNSGNNYGFVTTSDGHHLLISAVQGSSNSAIDLRKYDSSGSLVTTYGTNGVTVIEDQNIDLYPDRAFVGASGAIYVVAVEPTGMGLNYHLVKLDSLGDLVSAFGTNGILDLSSMPGSQFSRGVSEGPNGEVYVTSGNSGQSVSLFVSKYTASGIDSNYGTNGSIDVTASGGRMVLALSDGSLLVGGSLQGQMNIAKYSSAGTLDGTWGTAGVLSFGNPSTSESLQLMTLDGTSVVITYRVSSPPQPGQNGPPPSSLGVARINLTGSVDTTFGIDGGVVTPTRAMYSYPWDTKVLSDGSILVLVLKDNGSDMTSGFLRFSSTGDLDSAFASNETILEHGSCIVFPGGFVDLGNGALLYSGTKQDGNFMSVDTVIGKFTVAAVTAGANGGGFTGSSPSPNNNPSPAPVTPPATTPPADDDDDAPAPRVPGRPNLVTDENRPNLVRTPGQGGAVIDGEDRPVRTETVNVPAAQVRPERRTPAQVNQIRQAANELVQQFTRQMPAGVQSPVEVVNTQTGAIIRGLVSDENGNPVDVPAEDVVIITAEQMVVMVGSQNANVTPDGRFQVPVGSTFGLAGTGFGPEEAGEFIVMSTPTLITEFETSDVGTFDKSGTLPETIGIGDHTLVVATGTTYAVLGIQVIPTTLPVTGSSNDIVVVFALFTLVFGALLMRSRRTLLV